MTPARAAATLFLSSLLSLGTGATLACGGGGGGGGGGGSGGSGGGSGGSGGGSGGGSASAGAYLADPQVETSTPQLARDGQGVLHLLAASATAPATGQAATRYGRCAQNCELASSWGWVTLDNGAYSTDVKLAVEPSGRLHLAELFTGGTPLVRYAQCSSNCLVASSWTSVDVTPPGGFTLVRLPRGRALAATSNGKPRLLVQVQTGAGPQVALLGCDGTCLDGTGWQMDPLVDGSASAAALVSSGAGHQAIVAVEQGWALWAAECAANCGAAASWTTGAVLQGNPFTLGLDRSPGGELHLAWASSLAGGSDRTLYGRCASNCTQAASWTTTDVGSGDDARGGLDVSVGAAGQLAIARATVANDVQRLNWTRCAANCTQAASWTVAALEEGADVRDAHPAQSGAACDPAQTRRFWAVGGFVQLVPRAAGGWHAAYDAVSYAQCLSSAQSYVSGRFVRVKAAP